MLSERAKEARRHRVGASEVGGLTPEGHRYSQPWHIYDRIINGDSWEAEPGSPAWVGNQLEATISRMAREAFGLRHRLTSRPAVHPTLPLSATADGIARDYLVEIKVTSAWGYRAGEAPTYIIDQIQAQMGLYKKPVAFLVVLNGSRFWCERYSFDPVRFAQLEAAVATFERDHLIPLRRPDQPADFRSN